MLVNADTEIRTVADGLNDAFDYRCRIISASLPCLPNSPSTPWMAAVGNLSVWGCCIATMEFHLVRVWMHLRSLPST